MGFLRLGQFGVHLGGGHRGLSDLLRSRDGICRGVRFFGVHQPHGRLHLCHSSRLPVHQSVGPLLSRLGGGGGQQAILHAHLCLPGSSGLCFLIFLHHQRLVAGLVSSVPGVLLLCGIFGFLQQLLTGNCRPRRTRRPECARFCHGVFWQQFFAHRRTGSRSESSVVWSGGHHGLDYSLEFCFGGPLVVGVW